MTVRLCTGSPHYLPLQNLFLIDHRQASGYTEHLSPMNHMMVEHVANAGMFDQPAGLQSANMVMAAALQQQWISL